MDRGERSTVCACYPPHARPYPVLSARSYLYAHCCVELDRLAEAEAALLPAEEGLFAVRQKGPTACRALLLAQVRVYGELRLV